MLVMYVVPLTILVVLNIAIGLTIHRARLHRHSIVANGYASSNEFTRTSQDFSRTASSYNEGPALVINGSQSRRTRYVYPNIQNPMPILIFNELDNTGRTVNDMFFLRHALGNA